MHPISVNNIVKKFSEALPIKRGINFHLLSSFGKSVAKPLLEELIKGGFTNCFVTSYIGEFKYDAMPTARIREPIKVIDFYTKERLDERGHVRHRHYNPDVADNKVITYWDQGSVKQQGYQQWIKEHIERYSQKERKNLWIHNNIAIMIEISSWIEDEMLKLSNSNLKKVIFCLIEVASLFHINCFAPGYNEGDILNMNLGLLRSIDHLLIMPKYDYRKEFAQLHEAYEQFRKAIYPIIPAELEDLGYDIKSFQNPITEGSKTRKVCNLKQPENLIRLILEGYILDFSVFIF